MNILRTTIASQSLKFIPRRYNDTVTVTITNSNTKEVVTITGPTTTANGYQVFTESFNLIEGSFYTYEVTEITELAKVIYRGQIFCTDQTDFSIYDMNKDGYITSNDKDETIIF